MSAGNLKDKVLGRARSEAQDVIGHATKEAEEHASLVLSHAEKKAERTVAQARETAQAARQRALSAFEREAQQQRLAEKNRLIEEAFEEAASQFRALADEQLADIFRKELAGEDLSGAVVVVPTGKTGLFRGLLAPDIRIEEAPDLDHGYRLAYEGYRVDRSLTARLDEARQALRSRLAEILFGRLE